MDRESEFFILFQNLATVWFLKTDQKSRSSLLQVVGYLSFALFLADRLPHSLSPFLGAIDLFRWLLDDKSDPALIPLWFFNEQVDDRYLDPNYMPASIGPPRTWSDMAQDPQCIADLLKHLPTPVPDQPGNHGVGSVTRRTNKTKIKLHSVKTEEGGQ
jgi:hypothetical protein